MKKIIKKIKNAWNNNRIVFLFTVVLITFVVVFSSMLISMYAGSGDKYGNSHFLMSFFKDGDGSILVNCNEDCENCPMEMLGEKCE